MKKLIFIILLLYSCTPRLVIVNHDINSSRAVVVDYEPFITLEADTFDLKNRVLIAEIEVKDNLLSFDCSYDAVKKIVQDTARTLGGNCVIITEHLKPDLKSTCHRIKAQVLKIENASDFENEILWHRKRPLKIFDFKADTLQRPFQAQTVSSIRYFALKKPVDSKFIVTIESFFDCNLSYFKSSESDNWILKHEQLHFDITEIYARKFRKRLTEEVVSYDDFLEKHEQIFTTIIEELFAKQDEYDSEVYKDRSLQIKWNNWVKSELEQSNDYSANVITIDSN